MLELNNTCCTNIIVHGGTLFKSVSKVQLSGKPSFWESVSFHRKMLGLTNFEIVLGISIVYVVIFIKLVNLFRISFCELLMIHMQYVMCDA